MSDLLKRLPALVDIAASACRRWPKAMLLVLLAALCAGAAVGCGIAALWIYLVPLIGAVGAPLVVAGVFLVLCLILLAAARSVLRSRKPVRVKIDGSEIEIGDVERLIRGHKGTALLIAVVAGLLAANQARKR